MFFNCINSIKMCSQWNKKGFIIQNNKKNINLLKIFIRLNIVKYIKIERKYIFVRINYVNNRPIFKNIVNLYKPSHNYYISLKNLKHVTKNHNWILILSTSKGLMLNFDAVKYNIGGLLIAKIWN